MSPRFRVSSDGFLDLRDTRRVRTPGKFEPSVGATPEDQAVSFLLSHSFPGHRRVVRSLNESDRRKIQMALWADSVAERMTLVDRVWRRITEPATPPSRASEPILLQVLSYGDTWAYPVYLDGNVTRVIPHGGVPLGEIDVAAKAAGPGRMDLRSA